MYIKSIHLENFRCFSDYKLEFGQNTTVLIGKNGSGKTTVLAGLRAAVSFIFSKYKGSNYSPLSTTPDLHITNIKPTDALFDNDKRSYQYPVSIHCEAISQSFTTHEASNALKWQLQKNGPNGKLQESKYRDAIVAFLHYFNQDTAKAPLPVLAYYSDSYPHKKIDLRSYARNELKKTGPLPRSFGYYMWDAEANCAEIWQNRYISTYSIINDFKNDPAETIKQKEEIDFIDERLKRFTVAIDPVFPDKNHELGIIKLTLLRPTKTTTYIEFHFNDGRKILFEQLPMGYARLFSIVFDISYRSYIINGPIEPQGIVIIDELDLHLHPTLQVEVLQRLQRCFPAVQFIVSTHSPLIISNLKTDGKKSKIVRLLNSGYDYQNEQVENVYGMDYNTNLIQVMGTQARASTVEKLLTAFFLLHSRGRKVEADGVYSKLQEYLGGTVPDFLLQEIEKRLKAY